MKKFLILFASLLIAGGHAYSQDIIVKNDGTVINAYRTDFSGQLVYYQTEDTDSAPIFRIKKEDVLVIRFADGTSLTPNAAPSEHSGEQSDKQTPPHVEEREFPDIDLTDYHGFLLDKGNCVYVAYNTKINYELKAVEAIKHAIAEDGLWTVVDKPSQAHFILQYNVSLFGKDFARLLFRTRDNYEQIPYIDLAWGDSKASFFLCGGDYTSEDVDENVNVAKSVITHLLRDYRNALESEEFMESVKTGVRVKPKNKGEKWYVIDYVTIRYEAKSPQIEALHAKFYR